MSGKRVKTGRFSTIPRAGRWFILAIVVTLVPAYALSVSLMFLMAAMLIAILIYNLIAVSLAIRALTIDIVDIPRLYAQRPSMLRLELRNQQKFIGSGYITLDLVLEGIEGEPTRCQWLGSGQTAVVNLALHPQKRGRANLIACELHTAYPFGLIARHQVHQMDRDLLIYPQPLENGSRNLNTKRVQTGVVPRNSEDYQYLTAYQPGDDVRRIHWRKSAVLENPVLKRDLVSLRSMTPRLFVPDRCPHFEYAVSLLATRFYEDESVSGWAVVTSSGIVEPGGREELLRHLALIEPLPPGHDVTAYEAAGFRPVFASQLTPEES